MEIRFNPLHYAYVHPLLWPVVFLRLWQLWWWTWLHQREVIYEVLPCGHVAVLLVSDDPQDLRAWMARQTQAARPHLGYMDNADGALDASAIAVYVGKAMQRFGCFIRWVSGRRVVRALPVIDDSG